MDSTLPRPAANERREPVTCGIPWPRGVLNDLDDLRLHNEQGRPIPLQVRALDRWPDGSVRWSLLDWQADIRGAAVYRLNIATASRGRQPPEMAAGPRLQAETRPGEVVVDTGVSSLPPCGRRGHFLSLPSSRAAWKSWTLGGRGSTLEDEGGRVYSLLIRRLVIEESGAAADGGAG